MVELYLLIEKDQMKEKFNSLQYATQIYLKRVGYLVISCIILCSITSGAMTFCLLIVKSTDYNEGVLQPKCN